jgi:hypothetical protein
VAVITMLHTTSSCKCVCMISSHPTVNTTKCYKK